MQLARWAAPHLLWSLPVEADPDWIDGRIKLADQLVFEGRTEEGIAQFREVFARGRAPSALRSFGIALGQAGYLDDAECVLIDSIVHDPNDHEALFNYGVTLAVAPDRPVAYPDMAGALLLRLNQHIASGVVRWDPGLKAALEHRTREAGQPGAATWQVGQCAALIARRN